MSNEQAFSYDIAVIGMAGRFPGAGNVNEFWQNLRTGNEAITFFSDEELLRNGVDPTLLSDPNYVKAGAVIDRPEYFDASFFNFTRREAEMTDPQHRLFLEHAWQALESAGYDAEKYAGRVGVFAGESFNSYLLHNLIPSRDLIESVGVFQVLIGNDRDHLTTSTAYKLNLQGPCVSVQTACSTSLVAVHLACQSLLNHECDMALAGGVSIGAPQIQGAMYQEGGIVSPDGHCSAFDAKAAGTVKGNGVGVVLLKRLANALTDGDTIEAVIKGSAINNDGSSKVGYTAPSVAGQAGVIAEAMAMAGVEAETIGYVETHGTGTALGDPIEIAALSQAFGIDGTTKSCAIGSVKTNVGHLDAAAGVTGLIKAVLAVKHKQIPASLHFEQPNPNIDFSRTPFYVNTRLSDWQPDGLPRRAGVSSFGIGGTNAHLVIEEAPARVTSSDSNTSRPHQLLTLSAKTGTALDQMTENLATYLQTHSQVDLADVAHTLLQGRKRFRHRRTLVCKDLDDAVSALTSIDSRRVHSHFREQDANEVVFMFPGQGSQHANMARELYRQETVFREEIDRSSEMLRAPLGLDLRALMYPEPDSVAHASAQLKQTFVAQPALFAIEYALAKQMMFWGIRPQAMIGHSIGEFVAACLAGVFSFEDALKLVVSRGRTMQSMPPGAMLAVSLSESELQAFVSGSLAVAAINGPSHCVISGASDHIAQAEQRLAAAGVVYQTLHTSHAYHSEMMEPAARLFAEEVAAIKLNSPEIPYVSSLTGTWIKAEEATSASYWSRQLREPVRFGAGIAELIKSPERVLLEVGPGNALRTLARAQLNGNEGPLMFASLPHPSDTTSDAAHLLGTLGHLWASGIEVDWAAFYAGEKRRRIPLPTYPFERERYWIEPPLSAGSSSAEALRRKTEPADWFYVPSWKRSIAISEAAEPVAGSKSGCCVVLADEAGLSELAARQLANKSRHVLLINPGERFNKVSDWVFEINPGRREDYQSLLDELNTRAVNPEMILHGWGIGRAVEGDSALDSLEASQTRTYDSLLLLVQALGENLLAHPLNLVVVTDGLQEVTGEETLAPEKALVLGLCKVIPQEYAQISCRSIDVVLPEQELEKEKLANNLVTELMQSDSEPIVAYRGRHRWVQTFEPIKFAKTSEESPGQARLHDGGAYLFTGGPGEIDLALAESVASSVHCKLVLNGYHDFPDRLQWPQWLETHEQEDAVSRRLRRLLELEQSGAEVMLCNVDVGSVEEMTALMTQAHERFGAIDGVFHTAAVTGGGIIQMKTPASMAEVFRPKVRGTLVLQSLMREAPPDFFVLFSTVLSLTGVFGQVDYCAANAFMDAFARAQQPTEATLTVAVNWNLPHWEDWQSSIAGAPEFQAQFARMRNDYGISPAEGAAAVRRILSGRMSQVIVSTQDFQALINAQALAAGDLLDQLQPASLSAADDERRAANYAAPEGEIEERVAIIWQELFGIPRIGRLDNFFELGGNSLIAIQLVSQLRKVFQAELPLSRLFESPTVEGLTRAVIESQQKAKETEEIERLLSEIEELSVDELQAYLSQESQSRGEQSLDG
jgi:acyl transferase domain-containing protein